MTAIGQVLDGRYKIVQLLGGGGFGQTYIAENTRIPGHPKCVVKQLRPSSNDPNLFATVKRLFDSEAEMLSRLGSHDRIPRIVDFFDENQEFYLVQELIEGHPLSRELTSGKKLSESYTIALLKDLLPTLEFIHQQNVIHRDIKPDNIIRRDRDGKLVLIDFGAVKELQGVTATVAGGTVAIGTPGYMPTEQGMGRPRPSSDLYALGMICIQALTGRSPLELTEDPNTGDVVWQHLATISPELAALINKMVRYHFKDRYQSATEVLQSLHELDNPVLPPNRPIPPVTPQPYQPTIPVPPPVNSLSADPTLAAIPAVRPSPAPTPQRGVPVVPLLAILGLGAIAAGAYFILPRLQTTNPPVANSDGEFPQELLSEKCRIVAPTKGEVTAKLRREPVREREAIKILSAGEKVVYISEYSGSITDEQDKFVRIKTEDGSAGWVFRSEIQPCDSSAIANTNSPAIEPTSEVTPTPTATPEITPTPQPTPTPEPSPTPEETPASSPTPDTNITQEQAVDLVRNWLASKPQVFGQSYDPKPIDEYTTGSYYRDNLESLNKQEETGEYYEFGTPAIQNIGEFSISGDRAFIILTIRETTIRYRNGNAVRSRPSSTRRWELRNVGDRWKISNNPKV